MMNSPLRNTARALLISLLIFLLTLGAALAAPFVSPKGYSFTPVPGWQVNSSGLMGTDVAVLGPPFAGFRPNLNVVITAAPPGETLQDGQKQIVAFYPRSFPGCRILSSGVGTLNGVPVLNVLCTYQRGASRLRMRQVVSLHGGHVYTFTFTVPDAAHARLDPLGAQMLQSVKWGK